MPRAGSVVVAAHDLRSLRAASARGVEERQHGVGSRRPRRLILAGRERVVRRDRGRAVGIGDGVKVAVRIVGVGVGDAARPDAWVCGGERLSLASWPR